MDVHTGRRRPFPAVAIVSMLFLICIFPGQSWIATLFPGISGLVGINPSLVILDIPNPLPVGIDLILAPGLFLLAYPIVVLFYPSRGGIPSWQQAIERTRSVFAGGVILLFCILSGGSIYYLAQGYLPRNIRNGINSFGINADIYLPFPGYEVVRLRGSMVLFVCFVIGLSICIRKIRKEPGMRKVGRLTREQRMTPYKRMLEEKRLKEKERMQEKQGVQETAITKKAGMKKKDYKTDGNRQSVVPEGGHGVFAGMETDTTRLDRIDSRGLCRSHPVMSFEPEAVSYMRKL